MDWTLPGDAAKWYKTAARHHTIDTRLVFLMRESKHGIMYTAEEGVQVAAVGFSDNGGAIVGLNLGSRNIEAQQQ